MPAVPLQYLFGSVLAVAFRCARGRGCTGASAFGDVVLAFTFALRHTGGVAAASGSWMLKVLLSSKVWRLRSTLRSRKKRNGTLFFLEWT